jgi:cysteinyl-tRNA synthetase
MYVCGPTVNGLPHLGHGRFSLVWDVVRRWLTWNGIEVNYVSNVTDIDDRIIAKAIEDGTAEPVVAAAYEAQWWKAMSALGVARPTHVPHATEFIAEMVALITRLMDRGVAYETSDGVYFDVAKVPDYGLLAGQPLDSLRSGARIEANDEKRSPLDFALWKKAKPGEPTWPAPFGDGRPGWHTECVVMSLALLGDGFDLHCGGQDLKFPHHENERAQAVADGSVFARRWDHNGWVEVGGQKMGKSLNNFTTLVELLEQTDQRAYRLLVLRSHYRSPIEVSPSTIADAERALERLDSLARRFTLRELAGERLERRDEFEWTASTSELADRFASFIDNDLDTPSALALVFDALSEANALADAGRDDDALAHANAVNCLLGALGLPLRARLQEVDAAAAALVAARDAARSAKDWAQADRLRDELVDLGWIVEDSAAGTVIRR